jgi:hypothetical protein
MNLTTPKYIRKVSSISLRGPNISSPSVFCRFLRLELVSCIIAPPFRDMDEKGNTKPSSSSVTIHVRHKRSYNLITMVMPPGSSVRDLKLDVSSKRIWDDIKTKDDIRKIVRPGERVPLWERYLFTDKDDGSCFIVVPKPGTSILAPIIET